VKIENAVLDVLGNASINENALVLTGTLDRKLYVAVNKVLELAGGKWNRSAKAHIFPSDAAEIMDQIILTGEIQNKKQELGYFPTPSKVVARLLELAEIEQGMLVLEPSAGQGAIAVEMAKLDATVHCFEIDPSNANRLAGNLFGVSPEYKVTREDFLTVTPQPIFARVVMNPPFAKNVSARHVLHAIDFLAPNGRLVSVMPSSIVFRTDSLNNNVRRLLTYIEPLPEDSFKESGTGVNTVIVTYNKPL
jgi:16S rRNA G966 N2-methylase RsmD